MADWENRTQRLALDSQIYQNLARWLRKSSAFRLTKNREGADYVLAGEIMSITLPSISWATRALATDVKLSLRARYVVKDLQTGKIIWEVAGKTYTSDYAADMSTGAFSETDALNEIVGDLAEDLYIGLLHRIRRQEQDELRAERRKEQAAQEKHEGREKRATPQGADGTADEEAPDVAPKPAPDLSEPGRTP